MADGRRKVGGGTPSLNPLRVAQRRARDEEENRDMMKEDRLVAQDYRKSAQDLQRAQLASTYYRMGLNPDGSPLAAGVPFTGGGTAPAVAPLPFGVAAPTAYASPLPLSYESGGAPPKAGGMAPSLAPVVGGGGMQGSLLPDGTMSFAPAAAPAPMQTFPQLAAATPAVSAPAPSANPYLSMPNIGGTNVPSNILNLTGPARADAQQVDMGLRESASAAQRLASGRAAVQALQAQQAQQNRDPWTRMQNGNNTFSTLESGATVMRTPDGNATLGSKYGSGSATYGQPVAKSFTTTGADGRSYSAPTLEKWKQDQIGERALGRASGSDADINRSSKLASSAQGRGSFLDQLELIHQNSLKKKA